MLHRARFRIAVLPIFPPDSHRSTRPFLRKKQRCFCGTIAATHNQRILPHVRIGLDETMMHFGQIFARHIQPPWMFRRTDRKQNVSRVISIFLFATVKASATRSHYEVIEIDTVDINNFFAGVDPQIAIEHKMNVVRK